MSEKKKKQRKNNKNKIKRKKRILNRLRADIKDAKKDIKENYKCEAILLLIGGIAFISFVLIKLLSPEKNTYSNIALLITLLIMLGSEVILVIKMCYRAITSDLKSVLFTLLMLFCWMFLDSSQTSTLVFTFIFELVVMKLLFNTDFRKNKIENKVCELNACDSKKKYSFNNEVFEQYNNTSLLIYRIMIYGLGIMPVFFYEIIMSVSSFRWTVSDSVEDYYLTCHMVKPMVNNITGEKNIDLWLFNTAGTIVDKYSKLTICFFFMGLFFIIIFLLLFTSTRVKMHMKLCRDRRERKQVKELLDNQCDEEYITNNIIFSESEILFVDIEEC